MDTFVVRLVLAITVLAWGSVLLHDLVTPDAPAETTVAPAAASDERDGPGLRAPSLAPTAAPANGTEPGRPPP